MHLRLIIDVKYDPNGESQEDLANRLENIPQLAAGEGLFTGETQAEVESWEYQVQLILPDPIGKAVRLR
jgi:hypothetical protein